MVCPNCETVYEGNYCPNCGQKTIHGRYTLAGLTSELFFSAFHIEKKGLPYTVRELSLRPGLAIRKVLEGQRLSLYPPFKYLVLIGAIVVVLSLRYKFFHTEEITSVGGQYKGFLDGFFKFAEEKATLLNLIAIPIFSFFSWLFFRSYGFNYAENLIMNTFITAQQLLFLIILVPFIEFIPGAKHILIPVYTFVIMIYNVWAYVQFYGSDKVSNYYRSIVTVATAYLYQFPVNMLVYYVVHNFISPHIHWIPEIDL